MTKPTTTESRLTERMSDSDIYLVLVGFLSAYWFGRKHEGLLRSDFSQMSSNDVKREVRRFIESLKVEDGINGGGQDGPQRVHVDTLSEP